MLSTDQNSEDSLRGQSTFSHTGYIGIGELSKPYVERGLASEGRDTTRGDRARWFNRFYLALLKECGDSIVNRKVGRTSKWFPLGQVDEARGVMEGIADYYGALPANGDSRDEKRLTKTDWLSLRLLMGKAYRDGAETCEEIAATISLTPQIAEKYLEAFYTERLQSWRESEEELLQEVQRELGGDATLNDAHMLENNYAPGLVKIGMEELKHRVLVGRIIR
jgi:hypothetical protein